MGCELVDGDSRIDKNKCDEEGNEMSSKTWGGETVGVKVT